MDNDIKDPNKDPNTPQDTPDTSSVTDAANIDGESDVSSKAPADSNEHASSGIGELGAPSGDTQPVTDSEKPAEEKPQDNGFPVQPMPTKLPVVEPKKRGKLVLIIVLVVVFLIAVGAAAYYMIVVNQPKVNTSSQATMVEEPKEEDNRTPAAKLIDKVKAAMKSTLVEDIKVVDTNGETKDGTVVYSLPSYQVKGYEFSNGSTTSYGVAVSSAEDDKEAVDNDFDAAVEVLKEEGLTAKPDLTATETEGQKSELYSSDTVVCSVMTLYEIRGSNYTGVACGDMSGYEEVAEKVKPFHEAFMVANPQLKDTIKDFPPYYALPEIHEGADGYKNADVQMFAVRGLFYQEPKSTKWTYLTGVQNTPTCDQFNTDELQKAFAGRPCYDGTKEVTVGAS